VFVLFSFVYFNPAVKLQFFSIIAILFTNYQPVSLRQLAYIIRHCIDLNYSEEMFSETRIMSNEYFEVVDDAFSR